MKNIVDNNKTQLANPASVKCDELGGENYNIESKNGQVRVCKFENGKVCGAWEVFNGKCYKNFTINEKRKQNKVYDIFEKYFDDKSLTLSKKIGLSYKIYEKVEKLTNAENLDLKTYKLIVNYIKIPLEYYMKKQIEIYFNENIDKIISKKPILGGSWYITDIEWISMNKAKYITKTDILLEKKYTFFRRRKWEIKNGIH